MIYYMFKNQNHPMKPRTFVTKHRRHSLSDPTRHIHDTSNNKFTASSPCYISQAAYRSVAACHPQV
jgi:hypothetical protein